jgi:hypothetical protein
MSLLPRSVLEAFEADATLWPGPMDPDRARLLELALSSVPADVQVSVLSALVDPERNAWARAALQGLALAGTAGVRIRGMVHDELVDLETPRGERLGLVPLGFKLPAHRWGAPDDVRRLTETLDRTFGHRGYVLYLRKPVPLDLEPAEIARAVQLWLGAIERGERDESHAVYEDGDVALELTLTGTTHDDDRSPRVFTVGPVTTLERLGAVDACVVDAAVRHEESVGDLPLVMVLGADRPWGLSRGYVEQLLYGTPDWVSSSRGPDRSVYEAGFRPNGRSLFSDPVCRNLVALWWVEPAQDAALGFDSVAYDNPWSPHQLSPPVRCPRFALSEDLHRDRVAVLRWEGRR